MIIPKELSVTVAIGSIKGEKVPDLLVWNRLFWNRRSYFGGLVGLTGNDGVVSIDSEKLCQQFVQNQLTFPMDYQVSLKECDDEIEVGIHGGKDFLAARNDALTSELTDPMARSLWNTAQNEHFHSVAARRPLMMIPSHSSVDLATRRLRQIDAE